MSAPMSPGRLAEIRAELADARAVAECGTGWTREEWRAVRQAFAHARLLAAEVERLRAETGVTPTPLRWGLDDVMWGDDDSVTVLLSGPDREPYVLELDADRAASLRGVLAGPERGDVS